MKKILKFALASVILFTGCNKIESPVVADDGAMHFNVQYPATKATETAFEAGDKFGVFITEYIDDKAQPLQLGGNYKNNVPVVFDGSSWKADPTIYWGESKYDVYAYYPYGNPSSVDEMPFSVALDQSIGETETSISAYEASDFLYASAKGVSSTGGSVNLLFEHKMSKFTINLIKGEDFEGDIPSEISIYVHGTVTDCLIDMETGDVIKNPYNQAKTIKAKKETGSIYTAILVPQMLTNKKPLVEIVYQDVSYMIESKFNFKTGVHHTLNVTLTSNPEKVKIEIGGDIVGWN